MPERDPQISRALTAMRTILIGQGSLAIGARFHERSLERDRKFRQFPPATGNRPDQRLRTKRYSKVAHAKVRQHWQTMGKLLPQIRYWLKTGYVATDKIISLHIPELYSIVRGKIGKTA